MMGVIDYFDKEGMRNMDLNYFQTFREVAVRQSFTKAAEELGYAQSSVTTQIQKLEKSIRSNYSNVTITIKSDLLQPGKNCSSSPDNSWRYMNIRRKS